MQDFQQGSGLEDVQGPAGAGVEAVQAASAGEVCHHLIEKVAPSQSLYCVVCHQIYFADHLDMCVTTNVCPANVRSGLWH